MANFLEHRGLFDKLLALKLSEDPAILSVSTKKVYARDSIQLADRRWNEYRDLIWRLGLERVVSSDKDRVRFSVDGPSILNGASEKGYLYSTLPVPLSVAKLRLDGFRPEHKNAQSDYQVYKQLAGNWYLYLVFE